MNKLMAVLLALALVAPASAWTILGDNILGNNFDYVTLRSPNNGDSLVFNATTRKWEAGSGGGGSLSIQTDGVAQGTASTLNFSNGLSASGGTTGNVSPTYGTGANTITQGNDARHNVTPAAGVRGNIPVVNAAGTAYTSIDEGTATDQALMSLGANTPGAFRALIATDIDELLTVEQLVDVDITSLAANHMLVRDGSSKWVNAAWAGDVTGSLAANTWTTLIANDVVTNAKIRNSGGLSFIGRSTSTTGDPDDIDGTANQIPIVDSAGNTLDFRTISGDLTNVTGVFTIANQAVSPAKMADLAGLSLLGRSASTSGVMAALTGTANQIPIVNSGGTALAFTTLSGDVTNASGVVTIANDAVTFAKFQNVAAKSLVGNGTNASADATALTGSANQIPIINSSGTALAFTSLSGDATNSNGVMTIAAQAVGVAKMTASATDVVFGRSSAGAGAGQEITFTSTARSLADDTSVGAMRTTLSAYGTVTKQVFSTPGTSTYTPTSGALHVIIECWGGGGAGGSVDGISTNNVSSAGGGAGGYSRLYTTAAAASGLTVTVGAAGTAAAAGNNNGGNGGDSSVGTICVAKGGTGGGACNGTTPPVGGAGGVAGTGDVTGTGPRGNPGFVNSGTTVLFPGGNGASSAVGTGGAGGTATSGVAAGSAGSGFASGGGGGIALNTATDTTGGNGTGGLVVITEFTP